MRLAGLITLAAMLGGCATMEQDRLGWTCIGQAGDAASRATSYRVLTHEGQQRSGATEWSRARGSDLVDLSARWSGDRGLPELNDGRFVFRIDPGSFAQVPGRVVLYSDAGQVASPFGTGSIRTIEVNGSQLRALRGRDLSLGIALYNRQGQLMAGSGIEWSALDQGLEFARKADATSLAASADYPRLCKRRQGATV